MIKKIQNAAIVHTPMTNITKPTRRITRLVIEIIAQHSKGYTKAILLKLITRLTLYMDHPAKGSIIIILLCIPITFFIFTILFLN